MNEQTTLPAEPEAKQEIVQIEPGPNLMILKPAIELEAAMERLRSLQTLVKKYFVKDVDYGVIPGTEKPTLYKSGADKFCDVYGLTDTYEILYAERDWIAGRFGYEIRCFLHYRGTDVLVSSGLGSCSTWEGKFRWRNGSRVCPECHASAIIKGKKEYGGGWVCFKKKDGCGTKFADNDVRITSQESGRIENPDIHDQINNVLKSAKKRAKVDAVLAATRSSGLFTQDLDELPPEEQEEPYGFILKGRLMEMKVKNNGVCAMRLSGEGGKGWIVIAHEEVANHAARCLPHGIPERALALELDCVESKAPNGQKYVKLLRILKKDGMDFVIDGMSEEFGQRDEMGAKIDTSDLTPVLEKSVEEAKKSRPKKDEEGVSAKSIIEGPLGSGMKAETMAALSRLDKQKSGHNWPMLFASARDKGYAESDVKDHYRTVYGVESGKELTTKQFAETVEAVARWAHLTK
jgi:hypothetical protein